MLRIAIDSGHGLNTSGKEVPSYIGYGKIKEWTLNDKIVRKVIDMLKDYENVQILRLDDPTGKRDVPLKERSKKANDWGADITISNHHNAGINGRSGGGLVLYVYPNSTKFTRAMAKDLYDCLIKETGLKGNRTTIVQERANLHMVRATSMAAVLIEHGFMDSPSDMKEIIKEEFSTKSARGIVKFLEKQYGIKRKVKPVEAPKQTVELYRVRKSWKDDKSQIGAFSNLQNAINMATRYAEQGYKVFDSTGKQVYPQTVNEPKKANISFKVKVTASGLNVRQEPNTKSKINTTIRDKGTYTIVDTKGKWGKLKSGAGWIHLDYTVKL